MGFGIKEIKGILAEAGMPNENIGAAAEEICGRHTTIMEAVKEERDTLKSDSEKLKTVEAELNKLKEKGDGGLKDQLENLKTEYSNYKKSVEEKELNAIREKAARKFYKEKGMTDEGIEIAIRGSASEISALEMDGDKIKDVSGLEMLTSGIYKGLIPVIEQGGSKTPNPKGAGGSDGGLTREKFHKMSYKDRLKVYEENKELYDEFTNKE